eukprot:CAMPEP_0115847986 /NCGR_PEP_ID=MMETSP0287-20121206/10678_1 /TAXON_ID=412157 /ORGANISM="Chrysochromulina rotalis, Strain UIO044" /LENGTH=430 /DNA_ID=CAMNT_0003301863 /DNA_START=67 /DNA_END=1360 /DNA_ORIENTATION=-
MAMNQAQMMFAVFIISMYLFLNSALNLLNRWALGIYGLNFPLIMTSCHMIFGACALSPMMMLQDHYNSRHAGVLANDWKGLTAIAIMNGFQIACNNASLTVMELSMNQIIRASIPVLVAILAVCIEAKVPSKGEMVCLFVISLGVMLAVWEESRNSMLGIILTFVSTIMQSIQMSLSGRVMSGRSGKLDSFQMTFYTGPVAFVTLAPFAFATEYTILADSLHNKPMATVGFLLGSCCVAVVYNVVLFQSVRTLSSVGTAILGNVKIVCLLFLSSLLLGELGGWSANQYLGCLLTFGAAGVFSYIKAAGASKPAPAPVANESKELLPTSKPQSTESEALGRPWNSQERPGTPGDLPLAAVQLPPERRGFALATEHGHATGRRTRGGEVLCGGGQGPAAIRVRTLTLMLGRGPVAMRTKFDVCTCMDVQSRV